MDTTLNISLAGFPFTIEEIAYIKLNQYLNKVKTHLGDTPDTPEIIKDIELRMAELLIARLAHRKVVDSTDVQFLIDTLGLPEQYLQEEASPVPPRPTEVLVRKLFRDARGGKIAGVFSGLAYFWRIDPLWLRLAFVSVLLFSIQNSFLAISTGAWFLIYFILWILVPAARTTSDYLQMQGKAVNIESISAYQPVPPTPNMFYRSASDKKIAGVLGALSARVPIDALWLRILWVLVVLGLVPWLKEFSGFLLLAYLLVWLFAPLQGEYENHSKPSEAVFSKLLLLGVGFALLLCFLLGFSVIVALLLYQHTDFHEFLGESYSFYVSISEHSTWLWGSLVGGTLFCLLCLLCVVFALRK